MGVIMGQVDAYLENINEGKTWDKVKQVWRDHKGKIIAGATAVAVAGAYKYNKDKKTKEPKPTPKSTEKKSDGFVDNNKSPELTPEEIKAKRKHDKKYHKMAKKYVAPPPGKKRPTVKQDKTKKRLDDTIQKRMNIKKQLKKIAKQKEIDDLEAAEAEYNKKS